MEQAEMSIAAYNRGTRAISEHITQQLRENRQRPTCDCGKEADWHGPANGRRVFACQSCYEEAYAPDGNPWQIREPNRPTPHAENGWQYHYGR